MKDKLGAQQNSNSGPFDPKTDVPKNYREHSNQAEHVGDLIRPKFRPTFDPATARDDQKVAGDNLDDKFVQIIEHDDILIRDNPGKIDIYSAKMQLRPKYFVNRYNWEKINTDEVVGYS